MNDKLTEERNKNALLTKENQHLKQNSDNINTMLAQIKTMNDRQQHILGAIIHLQQGYKKNGKTLKNLRQTYANTIQTLTNILSRNNLTINQQGQDSNEEDSQEEDEQEDTEAGPSQEEQDDEMKQAIAAIILD